MCQTFLAASLINFNFLFSRQRFNSMLYIGTTWNFDKQFPVFHFHKIEKKPSMLPLTLSLVPI